MSILLVDSIWNVIHSIIYLLNATESTPVWNSGVISAPQCHSLLWGSVLNTSFSNQPFPRCSFECSSVCYWNWIELNKWINVLQSPFLVSIENVNSDYYQRECSDLFINESLLHRKHEAQRHNSFLLFISSFLSLSPLAIVMQSATANRLTYRQINADGWGRTREIFLFKKRAITLKPERSQFTWIAGAMEIWLWCLVFGKYQKHRSRYASHRFRCFCLDDIWVRAVCVRARAMITSVVVVLLYCIRETRRTPYGRTSREVKNWDTKAQRCREQHQQQQQNMCSKTEPLWYILSSAGNQPNDEEKKYETKFGCSRRVDGEHGAASL